MCTRTHVLISSGSSSIKQSFCFSCGDSNLLNQAYSGIGFFRRFLLGLVFANQCVSICAAGGALVLRNDDSSSVVLQDDGEGWVDMKTWVTIALLFFVCCWYGVCSCMIRMIRPCLRCLYYVAKFVLSTIHRLSTRECAKVSVEVQTEEVWTSGDIFLSRTGSRYHNSPKCKWLLNASGQPCRRTPCLRCGVCLFDCGDEVLGPWSASLCLKSKEPEVGKHVAHSCNKHIVSTLIE